MNSEGTDTLSDFTQPIEKPVQETTENIPANVETTTVTNTVKVETPVSDDSEIKSSEAIPNLKDLKVVVQVKGESTGTVNSPVETELKPIITSVRGYNLRSTRLHEGDTDDNDDEPKQKKPKGAHPSRSGPSPERLLTHANALINKVSSFVSKPSNEPSNDGTVSNVETSSQTNDQMLPVETSNSTPVCNKPAWTIQCKICIDLFGSIKELNEHHRKDHGIVDCERCDKKFATHHKKGIGLEGYHCEHCGKVMQFSTQLKCHRVTGCDVLDLHVETSKGDSKTT